MVRSYPPQWHAMAGRWSARHTVHRAPLRARSTHTHPRTFRASSPPTRERVAVKRAPYSTERALRTRSPDARFDVRCGLPSAFSGPDLRGLGGVEVRASPEPPARRAGPQLRASRLQPPPGSRGAWGARRAPCLLPPPIGSFSVAKKAKPPRTRPPHVPATESGALGSVGASGASPGAAA